MNADEARRFVIGKLFSYTCFEGTRGAGRVNADGSVVGSIQIPGRGQAAARRLAARHLQVKGESVCASLRGLPMQPCFNLDRTDANSFRGSVSGLGFAYCTFTRHHARPRVAHRRAHEPLALRSSLAADSR